MNEVEKMYRNSGIEECNRLLKPCPFENECDGCEYNWYPEFTAEKQLELIKWLARKDYGNYTESLLISIRDGYNYLSAGITTDFGSECFYENYTFDNKQFDEAVAGLINTLWNKLTEEERKQIKNILESEVRE